MQNRGICKFFAIEVDEFGKRVYDIKVKKRTREDSE